MTNQQAIDRLRESISFYNTECPRDKVSKFKWEQMQKLIKVYQLAVTALEKQEPKKPVDAMRDHITTGWCPICGSYAYITMNYYSCCGQALNWKEGD